MKTLILLPLLLFTSSVFASATYVCHHGEQTLILQEIQSKDVYGYSPQCGERVDIVADYVVSYQANPNQRPIIRKGIVCQEDVGFLFTSLDHSLSVDMFLDELNQTTLTIGPREIGLFDCEFLEAK